MRSKQSLPVKKHIYQQQIKRHKDVIKAKNAEHNRLKRLEQKQ